MSYDIQIQFMEKELREWLDPKARDLRTPEEWVAWEEAIIELVTRRWVLDSYHNGQRDCPKCNPKPKPSRGKK